MDEYILSEEGHSSGDQRESENLGPETAGKNKLPKVFLAAAGSPRHVICAFLVTQICHVGH